MKEIGEISQATFKGPSIRNIEVDKPKSLKECKNFWDDVFAKASDLLEHLEKAVNKEIYARDCLSTYFDRIQQTPREGSDRGEWAGKRGESKFISQNSEVNEILKRNGLDGIEYRSGIPDFSKIAIATVKIDEMSDNRSDNFRQCDIKCAEKWNLEGRDGKTDWKARDVSDWRRINGYTWHERNDMITCDLIPAKVNKEFGHLGGVSECSKFKGVENEFDM